MSNGFLPVYIGDLSKTTLDCHIFEEFHFSIVWGKAPLNLERPIKRSLVLIVSIKFSNIRIHMLHVLAIGLDSKFVAIKSKYFHTKNRRARNGYRFIISVYKISRVKPLQLRHKNVFK